MALFEFIMVLVSIIIGLGLAEILTSLAHALLRRQISASSWHPLLFAFIVFITLVQVWWECWALHDVQQWGFLRVLALLVSPVLLFTLAHLLFPDSSSPDSLRDHYFENNRLLYSVVAATSIAGLTLQQLVFQTHFFALYNASAAAMLAGSIVLASTRNPTIHGSLLGIGALLCVFDVAVGMPSIS